MSTFRIASVTNNPKYNLLNAGNFLLSIGQAKAVDAQADGKKVLPPTVEEIRRVANVPYERTLMGYDDIENYLRALRQDYHASLKENEQGSMKGFLDYLQKTNGWNLDNYIKLYPANYFNPGRRGNIDESEIPGFSEPYGDLDILTSFIMQKHGSCRSCESNGRPVISPQEARAYQKDGLGQLAR